MCCQVCGINYDKLRRVSVPDETRTGYPANKVMSAKDEADLLDTLETPGSSKSNTHRSSPYRAINTISVIKTSQLTFKHRASCILGQAFHYSPENAFYIFNQQIYFII